MRHRTMCHREILDYHIPNNEDPGINYKDREHLPPTSKHWSDRMNIRILVKEKDRLDIELDHADMTLLHPLVEELLKDKAVTEAQYIMGHPELDKPVLRVRVSTGKPETPVKKAAKKLAGDFGGLREALEKGAK